MKTPFKPIGLGLILILVNVNLYVDLLPDFLGYLLIMVGVLRLDEPSCWRKGAVYLSVALAGASFPLMFPFLTARSGVGFHVQLDMWSIWSSVTTLGSLILMYILFQMMVNLSVSPTVYQKAKRLFPIYMWANISVFVIAPFTINLYESVAITLLIVSAVVRAITQVFMIRLIFLYHKAIVQEVERKREGSL